MRIEHSSRLVKSTDWITPVVSNGVREVRQDGKLISACVEMKTPEEFKEMVFDKDFNLYGFMANLCAIVEAVEYFKDIDMKIDLKL